MTYVAEEALRHGSSHAKQRLKQATRTHETHHERDYAGVVYKKNIVNESLHS